MRRDIDAKKSLAGGYQVTACGVTPSCALLSRCVMARPRQRTGTGSVRRVCTQEALLVRGRRVAAMHAQQVSRAASPRSAILPILTTAARPLHPTLHTLGPRPSTLDTQPLALDPSTLDPYVVRQLAEAELVRGGRDAHKAVRVAGAVPRREGGKGPLACSCMRDVRPAVRKQPQRRRAAQENALVGAQLVANAPKRSERRAALCIRLHRRRVAPARSATVSAGAARSV